MLTRRNKGVKHDAIILLSIPNNITLILSNTLSLKFSQLEKIIFLFQFIFNKFFFFILFSIKWKNYFSSWYVWVITTWLTSLKSLLFCNYCPIPLVGWRNRILFCSCPAFWNWLIASHLCCLICSSTQSLSLNCFL